jgi:ATP-dependent DNA helicase MPH1
MTENTHYKRVMELLDELCSQDAVVHPKMEKIKSLALEHFTPPDGSDASAGNDSRMMIFASLRDVIDDIVKYLNEENPIIRASRFIGQGAAKSGKGMSQKEQLKVRWYLNHTPRLIFLW